jgi:hypothetical protein
MREIRQEKRKNELELSLEDSFYVLYIIFQMVQTSFKRDASMMLQAGETKILTLQELAYLSGLLQNIEDIFSSDLIKFKKDTTELVFREAENFINEDEEIWEDWLTSRMKEIEDTNLTDKVVSDTKRLMSLTREQHMMYFPTDENASLELKKTRMFSRY